MVKQNGVLLRSPVHRTSTPGKIRRIFVRGAVGHPDLRAGALHGIGGAPGGGGHRDLQDRQLGVGEGHVQRLNGGEKTTRKNNKNTEKEENPG